jgi:hypothetical protein
MELNSKHNPGQKFYGISCSNFYVPTREVQEPLYFQPTDGGHHILSNDSFKLSAF